MSQVAFDSTPIGSKGGLNSSKSLFHDFVRPRGQQGKSSSSPFQGSPQNDNFDFIPLSYSSPISNRGRGSGGNRRGSNRGSFSSSSNNSSYNSNLSPYNVNRNQFRNSPSVSNNSSSIPYYDMEKSRRNFSHKKRRDNNFFVNAGNSDNISQYYHPSMLEDPWAELEQKLRIRSPEQNCRYGGKEVLEKSVSNLSSVDSLLSVSDSDEGADSQETGSTVSVSDGSS